jgi:hypothetical protein
MDNVPFKSVDDFLYTELTAFDRLVMPWVAGVQAPMYELIREETLREFCRRSGALIGLLPGIKMFDERIRYDLEGVTDTLDVLTLKRLYFEENGTQINENAYLMNQDRASFTLQSSYFGSYTDEVLIPLVSFTACRGTERVEADFFDRWADGIAAGIIANLAAMPRKSWTDNAAAIAYQGRYENAVANAKIAVSRNFNKYALRMRAPSFT